MTYVLNLVLVEVGNAVDNDPGKRAAEVDEFVHQKGHDTSGEDIVADVGIPGHPEFLKVVEVYIVLRNLFELVPVCVGGVRERVLKNSCRVAIDKVRLRVPEFNKVVYKGGVTHRYDMMQASLNPSIAAERERTRR